MMRNKHYQNQSKGVLWSIIVTHFYTGTVSDFLNNGLSATAERIKGFINFKGEENLQETASEIRAADIFLTNDKSMAKYDIERIFKRIYTAFGITKDEYYASETMAKAKQIINLFVKHPERLIVSVMLGAVLCGGVTAYTVNNYITSKNESYILAERTKEDIARTETISDLKENEVMLRSYLSRIAQTSITEKERITRHKIASVFKIANNQLSDTVCDEYASYVIEASKKYKVPPFKLAGLIIKESTVKRHSKSSAGALGLTQVMPLHVKTLRKEMPHLVKTSNDLLSPRASIHAGAFILSCYKDVYKRWDYAFKRYLGINKEYWDREHGNSYARNILKWERVASNIKVKNDEFSYKKENSTVTISPAEARVLLIAATIGTLNGDEIKYITHLITDNENVYNKIEKRIRDDKFKVSGKEYYEAKYVLKRDSVFSSSEVSPLMILTLKAMNEFYEERNSDELESLLVKIKSTGNKQRKSMLQKLEPNDIKVVSLTAVDEAVSLMSQNVAANKEMMTLFAER